MTVSAEFEGLYGFHGHRCPMSTMGARLGLAAMAALGATKADQFRLRGVYMARNCGLDGVQFVTGCTLGNSNLELDDAGRASFRLEWRDGSGGVTVSATDQALARFGLHKQRRTEIERERRRAGKERARQLDEEEKAGFEELIEWVQAAPDEELLTITG